MLENIVSLSISVDEKSIAIFRRKKRYLAPFENHVIDK